MSYETYPCYVRIGDEKGNEESVEIPTENDGTMLLSTLQAQYPDAIGLRFKSESGGWRGVRSSGSVLDPPLEGWGNKEYYITLPKTGAKRKFDDHVDATESKTRKMTTDLIVLGLPYSATEEDMKNYFEKFGKLDMYQIKSDPQTKKSRGFGFVRFKTVENEEEVLAANHTIMGRKVEVRYPKKEVQEDVATKLFVGRLPRGTTSEDLREYFSDYGVLNDVYVPDTFRGFGFVTFASQVTANHVLNKQHVIKGSSINLSYPTPKGGAGQMQQQNMGMQQMQYGYGNMQGTMQNNMQGNMQSNMQMNTQSNMQGNMQANMQKNTQGNMQVPQPGPGYGYGNQSNTGYYSYSYQSGGGMKAEK